MQIKKKGEGGKANVTLAQLEVKKVLPPRLFFSRTFVSLQSN